jgi:hypothetical protein
MKYLDIREINFQSLPRTFQKIFFYCRKYHQWYNKVRLYKINPEITIDKCQLQTINNFSQNYKISRRINYLYWRRFLFQIKLKCMSVYTPTDNKSPLNFVCTTCFWYNLHQVSSKSKDNRDGDFLMLRPSFKIQNIFFLSNKCSFE